MKSFGLHRRGNPSARHGRRAFIITAALALLTLAGIGAAYAVAIPKPAAVPGPLGLYYSTKPDRSGLVPLNLAQVRGDIYMSVDGEVGGVAKVSFWLDNPLASPIRAEVTYPYDFAGGAPDGSANAWRTNAVQDGQHVILIQVDKSDGTQQNIFARFTVNNAGAPSPTPTPSPTASPTPSPTPTSSPPPGGRDCPLPKYPSPACTGVPPGTALATINGDVTASTPGQVIENKRITGSVTVTATNVQIRNSEILGEVKVHENGSGSFTLTDSTVGPTSGCNGEAAVGTHSYTATRVYVRNFSDGFRNSGNNILIQDSYVHLCDVPDGHGDGIQGYLGGSNVVVRHNTIDQRDQENATAPVFWGDLSLGSVLQNNLLMGGSYTVRLYGSGFTFSGNKVVNGAWQYGAVDSDCGGIAWSNNHLVTIDANYNITATVGVLNCAG